MPWTANVDFYKDNPAVANVTMTYTEPPRPDAGLSAVCLSDAG